MNWRMLTVLENCTVFDGHSPELLSDQTIEVEEGQIRDIGKIRAPKGAARRIDLKGSYVIPGLIDAHFHAYGIELNPALVDAIKPELRGLHAKQILESALQRGF